MLKHWVFPRLLFTCCASCHWVTAEMKRYCRCVGFVVQNKRFSLGLGFSWLVWRVAGLTEAASSPIREGRKERKTTTQILQGVISVIGTFWNFKTTDNYPDLVLGAANLSSSPSKITPRLVSRSNSPAKHLSCGISGFSVEFKLLQSNAKKKKICKKWPVLEEL